MAREQVWKGVATSDGKCGCPMCCVAGLGAWWWLEPVGLPAGCSAACSCLQLAGAGWCCVPAAVQPCPLTYHANVPQEHATATLPHVLHCCTRCPSPATGTCRTAAASWPPGAWARPPCGPLPAPAPQALGQTSSYGSPAEQPGEGVCVRCRGQGVAGHGACLSGLGRVQGAGPAAAALCGSSTAAGGQLVLRCRGAEVQRQCGSVAVW